MIRRLRFAAIVAVAVSAGCEGATSDLQPFESPPETWLLLDTLRIGSIDDPETALSNVGSALPRSDGGIWVVEMQERAVRVFNGEGELHAIVGGPGAGPGEFGMPYGIGWWEGGSDTIWVSDEFAGRMSLFDRDGRFVRTEPMSVLEWDDYRVTHPSAMLRGGHALAAVGYRPGVQQWGSFPVVRFQFDANEPDQILVELDRTSGVQVRWQNSVLASGQHPLSDSPIATFSGPADRILITDRSTRGSGAGQSREAAAVTMLALSGRGDTLWSRSFEYPPEPIPEPEWEAIIQPHLESFRSFSQLEGRVTLAEAEEAYRASVIPPAHRPPIRSVHMDRSGRVLMEWKRAPEHPGELWLLDASGEPRAAMEIDGEPRVLGFEGPYLWMLELDELDVPYLVRYRFGP